jgi:hypothetical protein
MKPILPLLLAGSAVLAATRGTVWEVPRAQPEPATFTRVADAPWLSADEESEYEGSDQAGECPWAGTEDEADAPFEHPALEDSADADPHAGVQIASAEVVAPASPLRRSAASNGVSIAELYAQRTKLSEHIVRVRGVVVKRTDGILDQTYLHLRDGGGTAQLADQDLTVTTTEEFDLGEEVEIEGRVIVDRDLGLGYRYPVLLEASVRVGQRSSAQRVQNPAGDEL